MTDQTCAHDPLSYLPDGIVARRLARLRGEEARRVHRTGPALDRAHVEAMVGFLREGAEVFDYGNSLRAEAMLGGLPGAFAYPGFVPAYIRPLFCEGKGPFRWVALSGDARDIHRTDRAILELFPENDRSRAGSTRPGQGGVPGAAGADLLARLRGARSCRRRVQRPRGERLVAAPIVIGRDHLDCGSVASPYRETESMLDGSDAIADWPLLNALVSTSSGASWVSIHNGGGVGIGRSLHAGQVTVADGTALAGEKIARVLLNDPGTGSSGTSTPGTPTPRPSPKPKVCGSRCERAEWARSRSPASASSRRTTRTSARDPRPSSRCGGRARRGRGRLGRGIGGRAAADEGRDVGGAAVHPGFVDSHTHLSSPVIGPNEFAARMAGAPYDGGGILEPWLDARRPDRAARSLRARPAGGDAPRRLDDRRGEVRLRAHRRGRGPAVRLAAGLTTEVTFLGAHAVPRSSPGDARPTSSSSPGRCSSMRPGARWADAFCDPVAFSVEECREVLERGAGGRARPAPAREPARRHGGVELAVELGVAALTT